MSIAYIRFHVRDLARLGAMERFIDRLRDAKRSGDFPGNEDWLPYLDEPCWSYFQSLTPEEMTEWAADWKSTPVEIRLKDPTLSPHWDVDSWLDALRNGEFLVTGLKNSDSEGQLEIEPLAFPYGGASCLVAIPEVFGQVPFGLDDGMGYRQYVRPAHWLPRARRKARES